MANPLWVYNIRLQGSTANNKASLSFVLEYDDAATPMDLGGAQSAATQIREALVEVTDAVVSKESLSYLMGSSDSLPGGGVDCMDEAVIMVHLNDPGDLPKLHALRVPAPDSGLWLSDGETLNITNPDVASYVEQISQHAFISDGEQINLASGTAGIDSGHKRSRAKSYRKN